MPSDHADTVSLVETPTTTSTPAGARGAPRAVDNEAQAERAERERTFTTGGDEEGAPAPPPTASAPTPATARIASATAAIRRTERPSPFGVAQFPPLPIPPGLASKS